MYSTTKVYYDFLRKQETEREEKLSFVKKQVNEQMDEFMSEHGWVRKGKGQKIMYTKQFNGKDIVIVYRCNYHKDMGDGGLPEFVHDKSINISNEPLMDYFHWNDQKNSGWSLDVVMERMEVFYNKYTL